MKFTESTFSDYSAYKELLRYGYYALAEKRQALQHLLSSCSDRVIQQDDVS